jgi:hypothetical protein
VDVTARKRSTDFGFRPEVSPHHFAVKMHTSGQVVIEEWRTVRDDEQAVPPELKAILEPYYWERIAARVSEDFNRRLRLADLPAGRWKQRETLLAAHFGKELTLLAWAIEGADPTLIPAMLANWSGLVPEERWWFYTTINATFTRPGAPARGWHKAIKIAFAENPSEVQPSALLSAPSERNSRARASKSKRSAPVGDDHQLNLPGVQEDEACYDASDVEEHGRL